MEPLTENEIAALYKEREAIEKFLNPEPDPEREKWKKTASNRLAEIDKQLIPHFFPKPKEEGTQRKTEGGFVVMLKTGLQRIVDVDAAQDVLTKCPKGTGEKVLRWTADLELKEYKKLSTATKEILAPAIIEKPTKPKFEIVKQPD